ncbi:hypothetical protein DSO57_1005199 [Entomophthora muscae]|uniref:Uncharacterized protein n=1 Tax=Entomophthora muscae TaxID=34485 RepID=A0ACC2T884_9FUNG|nr:hypothetical protein DSO57_1005199 [Entomophthora muscae]
MFPFFANFGFDLESSSNLKESAFPQADGIANRMKEVHSNLIEFLTKARSEYKKYAARHHSLARNILWGLTSTSMPVT